MILVAGNRLGPYEILASIGAGGMGEVYRARDTRLHREVAIKVLPASFSQDVGRLRRFEQEARAASALNHPGILTIYDFGEHEGSPYLVAELLEGETLRERLAGDRLPVRKVLDYGAQIARGLAAAHEKGIVHRDLKPENLFVTKDGRIKILDFGLAKLTHPEARGVPVTLAPTQTEPTTPGVAMGTAGYMSPEQVRGIAADSRSDLFSFGAVLYEMLTGERGFRGDTAVETLNAILKEDPPELSRRVAELPPSLDRIVHHCLEKSPQERFQSARDIAFALESLSTPSSVPMASTAGLAVDSSGARRRSMLAALALVLGGLAVGAAAVRLLWRVRPPPAGPVRVQRLTEFSGLEEFPALSPDGRSIAFTADVDGRRQLWVRLVAGGPALQITRDPADHLYPRWSRDASSLVYFSPPLEGQEAGSLAEISALGGSPRRLATSLSGADVNLADDRIVFFRLGREKVELVVSERDGSGQKIVAEPETGYLYETPRWSPDGRWIAYERHHYGGRRGIWVVRTGEKKPKLVTTDRRSVSGFAWLPDSSGMVFSSSWGSILTYLQTFQLWTLRLDDTSLRQLTFGEASYTQPDVDRAGALVASRMRMRSDLWRFPVDGDAVDNVRRGSPITRQTAEVRTPSVSPDGREVVYLSDVAGHSNLWVTTLDTGQTRQLTFERDPDVQVGVPLWSPDGRQIAFYWEGENRFGYFVIQPDGSGRRQIIENGWWACWSRDSRWLYYQDQQAGSPGYLKKAPIVGGPPVIVRRERASMPALSPDGLTLYFGVPVPRAAGAVDLEIRSASPESAVSRVLARIPSHIMPEFGLLHPVISPDGRWLAFPLVDASTTNIWALATGDGAMHRITDFGHRPTFITRRVSWSPDGRFVYTAVSEGDADVVRFDGLKW